MPYQLISRNEYGTTTIEGSSNDVNELVKLARQKVTSDNIANALTLDEKMKDWESCFVEVLDDKGEPTTEAVYGGMKAGKHFLYHFKKKGVVEEVVLEDVTVPMKFYIGTDNGKDLYAGVPSMKHRGTYDLVTDLNHQALVDKTFYYILKR